MASAKGAYFRDCEDRSLGPVLRSAPLDHARGWARSFRPRRPYASALRAADKPLLACSLPSRQDHGGVRNQERTVDGDSFESSTSPSRGRMWLAKSPPYNSHVRTLRCGRWASQRSDHLAKVIGTKCDGSTKAPVLLHSPSSQKQLVVALSQPRPDLGARPPGEPLPGSPPHASWLGAEPSHRPASLT